MDTKSLSFSSDTERHRKKFIQYCMRLLSSTLLNMALQNLLLVTTADLIALQHQAVERNKAFLPRGVRLSFAIAIPSGGAAYPSARWILMEHSIRQGWKAFRASLHL